MPQRNIHPLLARFMPFIAIALMIAIFILGIFLFSYILIFVLIVGLISFVVAFIRTKFFSHAKNNSLHDAFIVDIKHEQKNKPTEKMGRIIEHDDLDEK